MEEMRRELGVKMDQETAEVRMFVGLLAAHQEQMLSVSLDQWDVPPAPPPCQLFIFSLLAISTQERQNRERNT